MGGEYVEIAHESFSTKTNASSPGFVLEAHGQFTTIAGEPWIVGSSGGVPEYSSFYRTEPAELHLTEGKEYELRFDYRILEE
jgi:hypothetical protein